jgi:glyoxylase-like metal-dependent hydrolase (beta-lactamase superfamily II)
MNVYTIEAGFFKLDGGAMFGVVPKTIWNKIAPADENNLCSLATRCLLIQEGDRLILIDTGIGEKQDEKFLRHYYLHGEDSLEKSLNKVGYTKDDVTDVVLTHLHFDHCGGAVTTENNRLLPAFRNAVYWTNEQHWYWALNPNDREKASFLKENFLPIQESGQLKFLEVSPLTAFTENIKIRFSFGHTQAMMLPQIHYRGKTIVYVSDLIPSVGHLPIPYLASYDVHPLKTMNEKKDLLAEACRNNYTLFFEHDPLNECCSLIKTEKGIRAKECFKLSELLSTHAEF